MLEVIYGSDNLLITPSNLDEMGFTSTTLLPFRFRSNSAPEKTIIVGSEGKLLLQEMVCRMLEVIHGSNNLLTMILNLDVMGFTSTTLLPTLFRSNSALEKTIIVGSEGELLL